MNRETLRRGRGYYRAGKVLWVVKRGNLLFGKVLGTYPYYVELNLDTGDNVCTCPLGGDCKHVAAVKTAFEEGDFIETADDDTPMIVPEAVAWVHLSKDPSAALDVVMKELLHSLNSDESGSKTAVLFLTALKLVSITRSIELLPKLEEVLGEYSETFSDYELTSKLRDRFRDVLISLEERKNGEK